MKGGKGADIRGSRGEIDADKEKRSRGVVKGSGRGQERRRGTRGVGGKEVRKQKGM